MCQTVLMPHPPQLILIAITVVLFFWLWKLESISKLAQDHTGSKCQN